MKLHQTPSHIIVEINIKARDLEEDETHNNEYERPKSKRNQKHSLH
jgi:hypothetical protein